MNNSPSTSPRLLLDGGDIEEGAGTARGVALSRALCRFKFFRAAPALTKSQISRAARTFAEAHAPFANTGMTVLRSPLGAEIWYWDNAQVATLLAGAAHDVSPESVWMRRGEGWRIVACADGFEAQYWERGALIASSWRRSPFEQAQWTAFVLNVDGVEHEPPGAPPLPVMLARDSTQWRREIIPRPLGWPDVERGAWTAALCGAALSAFFFGQNLRQNAASAQEARALARIEQRLADDPDIMRVRERVSLIRDFANTMGEPRAVQAMADAFGVFQRFDTPVRHWAVDGNSFRAIIAASATPTRDIVAALEQTPYLCSVTPDLANGEGDLEVRAQVAASPGDVCEPTQRGRAP